MIHFVAFKIQEPINFGLSHIAGGHITPLNHHLSVNHFIVKYVKW